MTEKFVWDRKVQLAFGAAILILFSVGVFSYRSIQASRESGEWVSHSHDILENLQGLELTMRAIESNNRGFVLTGNAAYQQAYDSELIRARQREAAIRRLTADNPQQQRLLPKTRIAGRAADPVCGSGNGLASTQWP